MGTSSSAVDAFGTTASASNVPTSLLGHIYVLGCAHLQGLLRSSTDGGDGETTAQEGAVEYGQVREFVR